MTYKFSPDSSAITSIDHNGSELLVEFRNGTWAYADPGMDLYEALAAADEDPSLSVGRTFNAVVKPTGGTKVWLDADGADTVPTPANGRVGLTR